MARMKGRQILTGVRSSPRRKSFTPRWRPKYNNRPQPPYLKKHVCVFWETALIINQNSGAASIHISDMCYIYTGQRALSLLFWRGSPNGNQCSPCRWLCQSCVLRPDKRPPADASPQLCGCRWSFVRAEHRDLAPAAATLRGGDPRASLFSNTKGWVITCYHFPYPSLSLIPLLCLMVFLMPTRQRMTVWSGGWARGRHAVCVLWCTRGPAMGEFGSGRAWSRLGISHKHLV